MNRSSVMAEGLKQYQLLWMKELKKLNCLKLQKHPYKESFESYSNRISRSSMM